MGESRNGTEGRKGVCASVRVRSCLYVPPSLVSYLLPEHFIGVFIQTMYMVFLLLFDQIEMGAQSLIG